MPKAVRANQLSHPADVAGKGFRGADFSLPRGLGEIPILVVDDVQEAQIVAVHTPQSDAHRQQQPRP